ncbi:MAG: MFS transporter [Chitinispirillales bacterium]|nr:MFS transporter [Chitinispirillales bacterium]
MTSDNEQPVNNNTLNQNPALMNWKKNTALFITGQAITLFGSMVVQYAILWHITLETKSGTMMTLFTIAGFLPMFLISPFGGVWADRFNRKLLINISDGVIAFVSLAIAILWMMGHTNYGILLVCAAIRALGQGVQNPAVGAVIPQIVPVDQLTKVNGIQTSVQSFCALAAPMVSAALMSFVSFQHIFLLDVVTAAVGMSVLIFFVKVPSLEKMKNDQKEVGYFHDLLAGMRYIRNHGFVLRLVIFMVIFMVFLAPLALLTPLQVVRNFGDEVWRLSTMEVFFSAGMIAGGVLIAAWGGFKNRMFTVAFGCLLTGLTAIALGITPNFAAYVAIIGISGITVPFTNTPVMVMLQSTVEQEFMGRVLSVFTMISSSMMPLAMLLFGPVADTVNINTILIVTGIGIIFMSASLLMSTTLRRVGRSGTAVSVEG